ncbi:MAG TPA: hypothetical protein VG759_05005 [Candidatus Angelobacter sp.]|jgi:hypothetical protein|nr:hypothetical protein [Candidatus Angelobacter sp.]
MRELAKSALSLSWAMSLLGVKQAMNLLSPQDRSRQSGGNAFEPVIQAAVSQMDPSLQGMFRTGDNMQRGFVNLMFGFLDPSALTKGWAPGTGSCSSGCSGQPSQGWGPVPPRPGGR